jgi:hypothetical protein
MDGRFASPREQDPPSQNVRFGEMIREGVDSRKSCFCWHGAMAVTTGRKNVAVDTRRARIGSICYACSASKDCRRTLRWKGLREDITLQRRFFLERAPQTKMGVAGQVTQIQKALDSRLRHWLPYRSGRHTKTWGHGQDEKLFSMPPPERKDDGLGDDWATAGGMHERPALSRLPQIGPTLQPTSQDVGTIQRAPQLVRAGTSDNSGVEETESWHVGGAKTGYAHHGLARRRPVPCPAHRDGPWKVRPATRPSALVGRPQVPEVRPLWERVGVR